MRDQFCLTVYDYEKKVGRLLMKVYLAGPITGLSYEKAVDWRRYAQIVLLEEGDIVAVSPMRSKDYLFG